MVKVAALTGTVLNRPMYGCLTREYAVAWRASRLTGPTAQWFEYGRLSR